LGHARSVVPVLIEVLPNKLQFLTSVDLAAVKRNWTTMPYVARDRSGAIVAVFKEENECAREQIDPWDSELLSFVGQRSLKEQLRDRPRIQLRPAPRQIRSHAR